MKLIDMQPCVKNPERNNFKNITKQDGSKYYCSGESSYFKGKYENRYNGNYNKGNDCNCKEKMNGLFKVF